MGAVREYAIGLIAAAMICGITMSFLKKSPAGVILKITCGLILIFCLVDPFLNITSGNFEALGLSIREEAKAAADQGRKTAEEELHRSIKQELEAYILDKAAALGLKIRVNVKLDNLPLPGPESVVVEGAVPPYQKQILEDILQRELGISKENQQWIS